MYGFIGKVLIVDLREKSYEIRDLNPDWAKDYLGGASLGARYLYDLMPAKTPVFAPESVLGFVSGITNGSRSFMGARYTVVSKSPVTGGWNDANSGGSFGPSIKKSGFDAVFVRGISERPVYIFINDRRVEFRDASALWGMKTSETENAIREELGYKDLGIALIGPAGEHLSHMAAVMNDTHRAAARGGSGAVMGSKKLKAVVCRGSFKAEVYDEDAVSAISRECVEDCKNPDNFMAAKFSKAGTGADYNSNVVMADTGIKNWAGTPEDMTEEQLAPLSTWSMDPVYKTRQTGCLNCNIRCSAIYKISNEKLNLEETARPEYETLGAFGSMLLNSDPVCANVLNWLSNEYGYDTISFGGTIAWLMECYNKGVFSLEELDGIDLKWGDTDAIVAVAHKICDYEGIGKALNLASQGAAKALGKGDEYLMTASGIELPMHDPRLNPGLARTYQYDPTPGRHVKAGLDIPYGFQPPEVKYNYEDTGDKDVGGIQGFEVCNSAGFCTFSMFLRNPGFNFRYIEAITGRSYNQEERDNAGFRAFTIRHAFNLREGFRRKDFVISDRLVGRPPLKGGPLEDVTVDSVKMGDNFYRSLGWNVEDAVPTKEFLHKVGGLDCVVSTLYPVQS
jgi:aldehyde:ferredoxin oxidoreductase